MRGRWSGRSHRCGRRQRHCVTAEFRSRRRSRDAVAYVRESGSDGALRDAQRRVAPRLGSKSVAALRASNRWNCRAGARRALIGPESPWQFESRHGVGQSCWFRSVGSDDPAGDAVVLMIGAAAIAFYALLVETRRRACRCSSAPRRRRDLGRHLRLLAGRVGGPARSARPRRTGDPRGLCRRPVRLGAAGALPARSSWGSSPPLSARRFGRVVGFLSNPHPGGLRLRRGLGCRRIQLDLPRIRSQTVAPCQI